MRLLSFETLLYVIIVSLFGFTLLIVFSGKRQPSYGSVAVDSSKVNLLLSEKWLNIKFCQFYMDFQDHEVGLGLRLRVVLRVGLGM